MPDKTEKSWIEDAADSILNSYPANRNELIGIIARHALKGCVIYPVSDDEETIEDRIMSRISEAFRAGVKIAPKDGTDAK